MQFEIENPEIYAILGGVILGAGMGFALGTAMESVAATILSAVGLSIMWGMIFYATTQSQQKDDAV